MSDLRSSITITVVEERPGWRAISRVNGGQAFEQTGGTVHAAVTKALADAGLVCPAHLSAARTGCEYLADRA